jgi:hypothetical protein
MVNLCVVETNLAGFDVAARIGDTGRVAHRFRTFRHAFLDAVFLEHGARDGSRAVPSRDLQIEGADAVAQFFHHRDKAAQFGGGIFPDRRDLRTLEMRPVAFHRFDKFVIRITGQPIIQGAHE